MADKRGAATYVHETKLKFSLLCSLASYVEIGKRDRTKIMFDQMIFCHEYFST